MNQEPIVSIVIPAYNAEKTISGLLSSIQKQTCKNLEVIVVDDGSQDSTAKICENFTDYIKIKLIRQKNSGVSEARNTGIMASHGRFLMFADADDSLKENCVELLVTANENEKYDLVCGSHIMLKTRNRKKEFLLQNKEYTGRNYKSLIYEITEKIPYAPWGKLFVTEIIKKNNICFPVSVPYGEDGIFFLRYLQCIRSVKTISKIVYNYNYTDINSAGSRYYRDFNVLLRNLADVRIAACRAVSGADYSETICCEYLTRCINHYILNERNEVNLISCLEKSVELFPEAHFYEREGRKDYRGWRCYIVGWILKNITLFSKTTIIKLKSEMTKDKKQSFE